MSHLADRTITLEAPYADVAKRFFAALIDGALLGAVNSLVLVLLYALRADFEVRASTIELGALAFSVLLGWLYAAGLESGPGRATLGKRVMALRVVDLEGRRLSFLKATGRHFGKVVSALPCFVGFLLAAVTPKRQALHDRLAGTLVLESR